MRNSFETQIEILGEDIPISIEYDYTPADRGCIGAPPEFCEEPWPEHIEIISVELSRYLNPGKSRPRLFAHAPILEVLGPIAIKSLEIIISQHEADMREGFGMRRYA